jgi:hypothetical protein
MLQSNTIDNLELSMSRFHLCNYGQYSLYRVTEFEESNIVFQLMRDLGYISDYQSSMLNHSLWEDYMYPKSLLPITESGDEEQMLSETPESNLLLDLIFFNSEERHNLQECSHKMYQVASYMLDFKCSFQCEQLQRTKYAGYVLNECCYSTPDLNVCVLREWLDGEVYLFVQVQYVPPVVSMFGQWNRIVITVDRPINAGREISCLEGLSEMEVLNVLGFPMLWMMPRWTFMLRDRSWLEYFSLEVTTLVGWYRVFQRLTGKRFYNTRKALSSCCKRFLHVKCWSVHMSHQSAFKVIDC